MKFSELREKHPGPWTYITMPTDPARGNVRVLDAKGQDVPLFVVLDFAKTASQALVPVQTS